MANSLLKGITVFSRDIQGDLESLEHDTYIIVGNVSTSESLPS